MNHSGALTGHTVVVTRPAGQARDLIALLDAAGAVPLPLPTIEIVPPESWEPLDAALAHLDRGAYEWVIVTSANGARALLERASIAGLGIDTKVAVVGGATAAVLYDAGIRVDLVPERSDSRGLAKALPTGSGRLLLPRVAHAPRTLVEHLEAAGWEVDEVPAYRTIRGNPRPEAVERVRSGRFDAVTFASPSAVRYFVELAGSPGSIGLSRHPAGERVVACIGPVTARAAEALGLRVDVVAPEQSDAGLVEALAAHVAAAASRPRHANIDP